MPPSNVDWTPAIVMLVAGLVIGAVFLIRILRTAKGRPEEAEPELEIRDLEAEADALIRRLREMEDASSKGDPGQLARERYALELEAAEALRQLDALGTEYDREVEEEEPEEADTATGGFLHAHPALRGFVWGALAVGSVAFLVWFVGRSSSEKTGTAAAGGGMGSPGPVANNQTAPDPEIDALLQTVQQNPDDLNARLRLAERYLMREQLMQVFEHTQYVLQREPENPRALTYQAFVRMAMGQFDQAEGMLDTAVAKDPGLLDAWVQKALLYTLSNRPDDAQKAIDQAAQQRPDQKQALENILSQMRANAAAEASAPVAAPFPEHPPIDASGGATTVPPPAANTPVAAASGGSGAVSGQIEIDPSVTGSVPANATVFVLARPAGVTAGPPSAVVRLTAGSFPLRFELTAANSMMGQPLPEKMMIEARLDSDGNAMTHGPSDLLAVVDGVGLGSSGVKLVLRR